MWKLQQEHVIHRYIKKNHTPTYPIFLGPVTRNTEFFFKVFHLMYAKGSIFMQSSNENNIFCYIVSHEPFLQSMTFIFYIVIP